MFPKSLSWACLEGCYFICFFYFKIFGTIFLLERPKILTTFSLASMEHLGRVNERKQKQAEKKKQNAGRVIYRRARLWTILWNFTN